MQLICAGYLSNAVLRYTYIIAQQRKGRDGINVKNLISIIIDPLLFLQNVPNVFSYFNLTLGLHVRSIGCWDFINLLSNMQGWSPKCQLLSSYQLHGHGQSVSLCQFEVIFQLPYMVLRSQAYRGEGRRYIPPPPLGKFGNKVRWGKQNFAKI